MTLFDEASQAGMSVIPDVTHPQRSHRVSASAWGDFAVVGSLVCHVRECVVFLQPREGSFNHMVGTQRRGACGAHFLNLSATHLS